MVFTTLRLHQLKKMGKHHLKKLRAFPPHLLVCFFPKVCFLVGTERVESTCSARATIRSIFRLLPYYDHDSITPVNYFRNLSIMTYTIPLWVCSRRKRVAMDVVEDFVKELNAAVKTQCMEAFEGGNHAEAVRLLPCVQEPKKLAPLLLHAASSMGWADIVKDLVTKYDFDPAFLDFERSTPVHKAARYGHVDVVRLLTQNFQSPPDSIDDEGYTPLLWACEEGHLDVVVFLTTEFKCDVNARYGSSYISALQCACRSGNLEIVQHFVTKCKADVQAKNEMGDTVLHLACLSGKLEIIQYLVSVCKADVQAKNGAGDTVLHWARQM